MSGLVKQWPPKLLQPQGQEDLQVCDLFFTQGPFGVG